MIAVTYTNRGICLSCHDVMWTTDAFADVCCPCGATALSPSGAAEPVTDEEHDVAVRDETGLDDDAFIMLIKL